MRRALFSIQQRSITGVAPVLFIPRVAPDVPHEEQVEKNTHIALELMRLQKGSTPETYVRKYNTPIEKLSEEIEELLGSAARLRRDVKDDEPLDKIGAMERALRHVLWSYYKDDGNKNFDEMQQWLVYTPSDQQRLTDLRQRAERLEKYAAYRKQHPNCTLPTMNLQEEYENVVDREALMDKRLRYDTLANSTLDRDEAQVEKLSRLYNQPKQLQRLDRICELLQRFRPILAREAIMQRLTVKHLEGKLGLWRYLDWNPEVRDRAELETDHYAQQWWYTNEEKRLSQIRLRSRQELTEIADRNAKAHTERLERNGKGAGTSAGTAASGDAVQAARDKLLEEIIRLQSRVGSKNQEDDKSSVSGEDTQKKLAASQAEIERKLVRVPEETVNERGVLGLEFISEETLHTAKEGATAKANA